MCKVSTRSVLWCLVFSGFAVNYMIRINLNIAIVAMVKRRDPSPDGSSSSTGSSGSCLQQKQPLYSDSTSVSPLDGYSTLEPVIQQDTEGFSWDERQQNLVLGAFFWVSWLMQLPGGVLAHKYGTKLVFGLANFAAVLCCFIIPPASHIHYSAVIVVRCLQGMFSGFTWPAMHSLTARWIPPNERSKFVTAYLGSSVGAALTFPMCGYVIHWAGWPLVFYLSGILGTIWFILWWCLVYDSPAEHPRITDKERDHIEKQIGSAISKQKVKPPWGRIMTSRAVWMNTLAQWGGIWGLFTLMTQAPTYLKQIHGWDIRSTGILSGIPHLLRMGFAAIFSQFGDYLLRTNKLSRTNVRKMATAVCCIGQGICTLGLAYVGCDKIAAVVLIMAATATNGAVSTGPLASFIDITPNYASVAMGFSGMISNIPGFISPAIVGWLTLNNQTTEQWRLVFLISTAQLFISGIAYVLFADSNIASWNDYGLTSKQEEIEDIQESEMCLKKPYIIKEDGFDSLMGHTPDSDIDEQTKN
ncbi:na[+]-dependent inorganic phosphate cotransporter [Arctopsyche grandis]|uniref:na[+]-dependent inorganic phosphate cotransporter n=1 Tax=Arctopsyche grandis TaxID=121162 RepID=UPI00406DA02D